MDNEQRKRFAKILNQPDLQPGDETALANNPRNWLADKVNPLLEEYVNPVLPESIQMAIPKMTVADEKNYQANLPEQMAGSAMGSIKTIPSQRFGKILQFGDEASSGLGKVTVKPTAADLAMDAQKAAMQGKQLKATDVMQRFNEKYGEAAKAQKARFKQEGNLLGYDSWKQEMLDKIRRGEE